MRALTTQLLLALCLLFSQQVLVAHAVAHTAKAAAQQDSSPGHQKVCEVCVLSVQLNDALVCQAALLLDARAPSVGVVATVNAQHPHSLRPYRSRAPPARA